MVLVMTFVKNRNMWQDMHAKHQCNVHGIEGALTKSHLTMVQSSPEPLRYFSACTHTQHATVNT